RDGLYLYELKGDKKRREFQKSSVRTVAFSKDGKQLASGGSDATVRVWDVQKGEEFRSMAVVKAEPVNQVAFSPDGKHLAVSQREDYARTFEVATGKPAHKLGPWWSEGIAYAPDGKTIATAGSDRVRLWDAATGKEDLRFDGHRR